MVIVIIVVCREAPVGVWHIMSLLGGGSADHTEASTPWSRTHSASVQAQVRSCGRNMYFVYLGFSIVELFGIVFGLPEAEVDAAKFNKRTA